MKAWKQANRPHVRAEAREWRRKNEATPEGRARARANEKSYRARHPEKTRAKNARNNKLYFPNIRNSNLKKLYGITQADYERMFEKQGGCCAICKAPDPGGKKRFLSVDHNHKTGKVRALLCDDCNVGLGRLRDDPELLRAALTYLAEHGEG